MCISHFLLRNLIEKESRNSCCIERFKPMSKLSKKTFRLTTAGPVIHQNLFQPLVSKNIFLSVRSSKQRNMDALIPPSDIVFTDVCMKKNISQNYLSFSVRVSIFSLQAVVTFSRIIREKITSPKLSSS